MHVNIYICIIWCIDCVFVTRNKHIFRRSCPLSLPFLGQETPDVAETEKPGTEKAGTVVFYVFFQFLFFFRQGHFPTQVFTCQEETQTSYGHRCGHIWSQYGVLRFMGIELRMWYYDTLDCTNIYIYVLQSAFLARRNLMRVSQIHQTNRRPSIHRVLLVSVLFASHTHIYICTRQVFGRKSAP